MRGARPETSRRAAVAAACLGAMLLRPAAADAWGHVAHQLVVSRAVETVPGGLKGFYKKHRLELPSLAPDAEFEAEGGDRRFAADRLMPFPFLDLPHREAEVKTRFPQAADVGRLPWLIQESYGKLVEAFRARDKARILAESDRITGLVADLHNPLALTDNDDGQKTGQHGLWVRFTVKLPEAMGGRLKLDPEAARYLDEPDAYVFSRINGIYIWGDNLLYLEELARRGQAGYGELYLDALEARAGGLVRSLLSEAATDAGSFWYTAWTAAGRPVLE